MFIHPSVLMTTQTELSPIDTHPPSPSISLQHRRCCFCIPYHWQKVHSSSPTHPPQPTLWSRGIHALKKIREWSEILAGPRWKTFIRRFNRNKSSGRNAASRFQYDPLAYALNFDEGPLENADFEVENEVILRNFSSRYAATATRINGPIASKVVDSKDAIGPNFV